MDMSKEPGGNDQRSIELYSPGTPGEWGPSGTKWFSSDAQVHDLMSCAVRCSNCSLHCAPSGGRVEKTLSQRHVSFRHLQVACLFLAL